ncbi:alpha/beta hydrolase [Aquimarina algicola]|nr:alpha/beta hydrolase-fold protein [Aquimarina algicola]
MIKLKEIVITSLFVILFFNLSAQDSICINKSIKHVIHSKFLNEDRDYWVSLPLHYTDSLKYPVIYVLDAEWRFELTKTITFELGAWNKIQKSIVVGIPHIDWENKRGQDLTFSQSRIEYDGDIVDSTWYNKSNSGGAMKFYNYLTKELIPKINQNYSTTGHETLVGHSYGGYFGGYILSLDHPFEVIHMYDPSIWFSDGEITNLFKKTDYNKPVNIHLTYQPKPKFHRKKIEEFIDELSKNSNIQLTTEFYEAETHNSLFLYSFYNGITKTNK